MHRGGWYFCRYVELDQSLFHEKQMHQDSNISVHQKKIKVEGYWFCSKWTGTCKCAYLFVT